MPMKPGSSALVVSIDLTSPPDAAGDALARSLLATAARHGIPCTWCSSHPAADERVTVVLEEKLDHEIALLVPFASLSQGEFRSESRREIAQQVLRARAAGYAVTTLAPLGVADSRREESAERWDAVYKLGITAIRTTAGQSAPQGGWFGALFGSPPPIAPPQTLRYRLWDLPVTFTLPNATGRLPSFAVARRAIDRAVRDKHLVQFSVDVPRAESAGSSGLKLFDKILEYASRHRLAGQLRIETLANVAARLSRSRPQSPAQSILRRRAA